MPTVDVTADAAARAEALYRDPPISAYCCACDPPPRAQNWNASAIEL